MNKVICAIAAATAVQAGMKFPCANGTKPIHLKASATIAEGCYMLDGKGAKYVLQPSSPDARWSVQVQGAGL